MAMKNPPHPGLSVRHDCLEPLGLSVTELRARACLASVASSSRMS